MNKLIGLHSYDQKCIQTTYNTCVYDLTELQTSLMDGHISMVLNIPINEVMKFSDRKSEIICQD